MKQASETQGSPAFYGLPVEVLDMIADAYCNDPYVVYLDSMLRRVPSRRQLRLITRDFSQLPSINRQLFRKITLIASREEVARLKSAPYELLAHWTEKVVFKPPQYSWLVNPKLFREIVTTQALHQSMGDHYKSAIGSTKHGIQSGSYLERYEYNFVHPLEDEPPFTEAQLDQVYLQ